MGQPSARKTDMHVCPMVNPGPVPHVGGPVSSHCGTVKIVGQLAARIGDLCDCTPVGAKDPIVSGSGTVIIEGSPAARLGDSTAHGGKIVTGAPTVFIG